MLLTDVEMAMALRLLPLLLSEAPLPVASAGTGKRKRNKWRPTAVETLQNFVDVQKVSVYNVNFLNICMNIA